MKSQVGVTKCVADNFSLWMRSHYSFSDLLKVVRLLQAFPEGLRPAELNRLILQRRLIQTKRGKPPSPSTLYHIRRALINLGLINKRNGRLVLASDDRLVRDLINKPEETEALSPEERRIFAEIVIRNPDCRHCFFDLFMPGRLTYTLEEFIRQGEPVIWRTLSEGKKRRVGFFRLDNEFICEINTGVELRAILYGIRYWARDELRVIDEFFREGMGNIMFPVEQPEDISIRQVIKEIINEVSADKEWTLLSIQDLLLKRSISLRIPVVQFLKAIRELYRAYPGYVAIIAAPPMLITLPADTVVEDGMVLRSYLEDEQGRYITHIKVHKYLKEVFDGEHRT